MNPTDPRSTFTRRGLLQLSIPAVLATLLPGPARTYAAGDPRKIDPQHLDRHGDHQDHHDGPPPGHTDTHGDSHVDHHEDTHGDSHWDL
jgi:hypothetical protein